ncbi:MAG: hypothetical protein LBS36_13760 [Oscillospiraceae bacterium]|jgi:hypothetical protein|nr:hypothetical protein [Oscillospiraceae bacterium]
MKKRCSKVLAFALAVIMAFTASVVVASAEQAETNSLSLVNELRNANGDYTPTIIVHGIAQSTVRVLDDDGNYLTTESGKEVKPFPPTADTNAIVKNVLGPALASLFFQADLGLSKAIDKTLLDVFKYSKTDLQGNPVYDLELERYETSLANLPAEKKEAVLSRMPLDEYAAVAGEENTYYFAYNSLGNTLDIADELAEFVQTVLDETGSDKVNLAPISLGGAIATAFFDLHKELYSKIEKVVYIIPAADGSPIVADIFKGEFNYADEMLYSQMLPSLVEGYQGYLLNLLIRILPKRVLTKALGSAVDSLANFLKTCTNMWALVPSGEYPALADKYLSGSEYAYLRARTDRFYQAQLNLKSNLVEMQAQGVKVFDIVDYDFPLYKFVTSWDKYNADGLINVESSTFGAHSVPLGQTLGDDYVQQNTYCTDPAHNHISPTRTVDASTGLLCERTWFFRTQDHEGTGRNDVIMKLCFELLLYDDIDNVHSDPRFPQFMDGRESKYLKYTLLPQAIEVRDSMQLDPAVLARLDAAIADTEELLSRGSDSHDRYIEVQETLENILIEIGVRQAPEKEPFMDQFLYIFFKKLSDAVYKMTGAAGYKDMNPIPKWFSSL